MSQVTKSRYKECSGPDGAGEPDVRGARLLVGHDGVRVLVVVEQNGLGGPAQQTVLLGGREKATNDKYFNSLELETKVREV